jgi:histidinol dehydrogenase
MENALNDLMNQYEEQRGGRVLPPTQRNLATVPQMVGAATPEDVQFVQHRMQVKYESRRRMQDVNNKVENMLQDNCRSLRNVGVFIPGC